MWNPLRIFSREPKAKAISIDGHTLSTAVDRIRARDDVVSPLEQNAWVLAGVRSKAEKAESVSWSLKIGKMGDKDAKSLPDENEWVQLLRKPSPLYQSWSFFIHTISMWMDLYGEAPLYCLSEDGEEPWKPGTVPAEIYLIPPSMISEQLNPITQLVDYWQVTMGSQSLKVDPSQIHIIRNPHPSNPHRGLSPLKAAGVSITLDFRLDVYGAALIGNGCDPGGTLTVPLGTTKERRDAIRDGWEDRHKGARKAGRLAMLDPGYVYQSIPVKAQDLGWTESRADAMAKIMAALGVTKWDLGVSDDYNRASAQSASVKTWQDSVIPRLNRISEALGTFLFTPYAEEGGDSIWLDFELSKVPALAYTLQDNIPAFQSFAQYYPLNRVRDALGLPFDDVDGGDEIPDGLLPSEPPPPTEGTGFVPPPTPPKRWHMKARRTGNPHSWGDRPEKVLRTEARRYFTMLNALAQKNLRAAKAWERKAPLTDAEIDAILGAEENWTKIVKGTVVGRFHYVATAAQRQVQQELGGFQLIDPGELIQRAITPQVAQMVRIAKQDRLRLRAKLIKLVSENGLSIVRDIANAIEGHFQIQSSRRALVIARTEVGFIGSKLRHDIFAGEEVLEREWSTANDGFVRPTHAAQDGEKRKTGERFTNGLLYPSEIGGRAEEVIQCRCVELAL
jgi:HK97 family phage portal protein